MSKDYSLTYDFLKDEFWQKFIDENYNKPLDKVLFSIIKKYEIDIPTLANQLKGKKIANTKLPSWKKYNSLIYPSQVSMEQCSSELSAKYKSEIVRGKSCIDLTGGFGIDSFFLANSFKNVWHCEINKELQFIAKHNFKVLSSDVQSISHDGISYLKATDKYFDLIYIDPSRRDSRNNKVIKLENYTPNILEHIPLLLRKGKQILLKTTPLVDIKQVLKQIPKVSQVHVVAINNECKELLFLINSKSSNKSTTICCKDLTKNVNFSFDFEKESQYTIDLSLPLKYLYEPNSSILKGGAFKSISKHYNLFKLHNNSHLYTSNKYLKGFPGRCFEIVADCGLNKKEILPLINGKKANISRRNFPISVREIRKKIGVLEGGENYLFATTLIDEKKRILVCKKC